MFDKLTSFVYNMFARKEERYITGTCDTVESRIQDKPHVKSYDSSYIRQTTPKVDQLSDSYESHSNAIRAVLDPNAGSVNAPDEFDFVCNNNQLDHNSTRKSKRRIISKTDPARDEFKSEQSNVLVVLTEPEQNELERYMSPRKASIQFSEFEREKIHRAIDMFNKATKIPTHNLGAVTINAPHGGYSKKLGELSEVFAEVYNLKISSDAKEYGAYLEILKGNVAVGIVDGHFKHYVTLKKVFSDTYYQMEEEKEMLKLQSEGERETHALMIASKYGYSPYSVQTMSRRITESLKNQSDLEMGAVNSYGEADNSDLLSQDRTFRYEDLGEVRARRPSERDAFDFNESEDVDYDTLMDKLNYKLNQNDGD